MRVYRDGNKRIFREAGGEKVEVKGAQQKLFSQGYLFTVPIPQQRAVAFNKKYGMQLKAQHLAVFRSIERQLGGSACPKKIFGGSEYTHITIAGVRSDFELGLEEKSYAAFPILAEKTLRKIINDLVAAQLFKKHLDGKRKAWFCKEKRYHELLISKVEAEEEKGNYLWDFNINQQVLLKARKLFYFKFDYTHAAIIEAFKAIFLYKRPKQQYENRHDWHEVSRKTLIKELPLFPLKSEDKLRKKLKTLVDLKILKQKKSRPHCWARGENFTAFARGTAITKPEYRERVSTIKKTALQPSHLEEIAKKNQVANPKEFSVGELRDIVTEWNVSNKVAAVKRYEKKAINLSYIMAKIKRENIKEKVTIYLTSANPPTKSLSNFLQNIKDQQSCDRSLLSHKKLAAVMQH